MYKSYADVGCFTCVPRNFIVFCLWIKGAWPAEIVQWNQCSSWAVVVQNSSNLAGEFWLMGRTVCLVDYENFILWIWGHDTDQQTNNYDIRVLRPQDCWNQREYRHIWLLYIGILTSLLKDLFCALFGNTLDTKLQVWDPDFFFF